VHIADRGLIEGKWFVRILRTRTVRHQHDHPKRQKAHEFHMISHRGEFSIQPGWIRSLFSFCCCFSGLAISSFGLVSPRSYG
jgi:hypothetical protein